MKKEYINEKLTYWRNVRDKYRAAYVALVENGVKTYMVDDRQLTHYDIATVERLLSKAEDKVDEYTAMLEDGGARKAFGIIPRDW